MGERMLSARGPTVSDTDGTYCEMPRLLDFRGTVLSLFHLYVSQKAPDTELSAFFPDNNLLGISLPWLTFPTLIVPSGSLLQTTHILKPSALGKPPPLSISKGMAARPLSLIICLIQTHIPCGLSAQLPAVRHLSGRGRNLSHLQRQKLEVEGTCREFTFSLYLYRNCP